ncbi:MAG: ABC transporter substrate-binding protein, partial [Candidatus Latescibacteria bacterium]|nr:ABC transporter substrate-binding protein [Candidatus Latescibacterota bacterium]
MRIHVPTVRICMIILILIMIFPGCGSNPDESSIVFRYRLGADPPNLDPIHCTDTSSATIVLKIFEGLVDQDPVTLEVVPAIAEHWEISGNGLTYTFHLKQGVLFHNGREVTSKDFRYSFERCLRRENRSERSWVLAPIMGARELLEGTAQTLKGMETPDDYTVILHLEKPFAPFISYLAMEAGRAVAREGVEGGTFSPIGTGPFKFISWKHDIRVSTEAFDLYHGGEVGLKRVDFEIIPDVGVAFQKFIAGELDFVEDVPPGQLKLIRERYPDSVKMWPYLRIEYIGFNHTRPPFKNNPKLRQALCWAVDSQRIVDDLMEGAAELPTGILPPGIMGRDETIEGYGYDIYRAKQLLSEAGYPEGKGLGELTLWYNTNERHEQV